MEERDKKKEKKENRKGKITKAGRRNRRNGMRKTESVAGWMKEETNWKWETTEEKRREGEGGSMGDGRRDVATK